jgi:hypothetical protein
MDKICLEELVQLHIVLGWFTQHLPVRLLVSLLMVSWFVDLPPVAPELFHSILRDSVVNLYRGLARLRSNFTG